MTVFVESKVVLLKGCRPLDTRRCGKKKKKICNERFVESVSRLGYYGSIPPMFQFQRWGLKRKPLARISNLIGVNPLHH